MLRVVLHLESCKTGIAVIFIQLLGSGRKCAFLRRVSTFCSHRSRLLQFAGIFSSAVAFVRERLPVLQGWNTRWVRMLLPGRAEQGERQRQNGFSALQSGDSGHVLLGVTCGF